MPASLELIAKVMVIALCLCSGTLAMATDKVVRLAVMESLPVLTRMPRLVLTEAYRRLGWQIEFVEMPVARALQEANSGNMDGEAGRFVQIEADAPNLRRVPVPVAWARYAPYVKTVPKMSLNNWDDLKKSGLRIGGKNGARIVETSLGEALTDRNRSYAALLMMLQFGRIDVLIAPVGRPQDVFAEASPEALAGIEGITILNVLAEQPLYHYLHESKMALIGPLTEELKRMERDGTLKRLRTEASH